MYKQILLNKVRDYLQKIKWPHTKSGSIVMLDCPFCVSESNKSSAQQIPNSHKINCHHCHKQYTLLEFIREVDKDKADMNEDDVYQYLKELLNVNVETKKDADNLAEIFDFFHKNEFDLVPIAKNAKNPIETNWPNKEHRNTEEWKQWIITGLNIGVKTGKRSNITVIDVDTKEIPESLRPYLETTLKQVTNKGYHFFFKYEDMPKTRIDEWKIDIENDGGQVVIQPSTIDGVKRTLNFKEILPMPEELKKFLMSKITVPRKTNSEIIKEEIETENFKLPMFDEGGRNASLIKLGGIFRKGLSAKQTEFVLNTLNNHNTNPLPYKEISAMARKLEHYIQYDEQELAHDIIEYLKLAEVASKAEIEIALLGKRATGEDKKRIDKTLVYLIKEEKIGKKGREYHLIKSMEWSDSIVDVGIPLSGVKIPYLDDYAYFNWGDLIIIGSQNKYGKTTLAMNFVKRLVEQGIKPYYIYSESGGRFGKTAWKLGMKDGDFWRLFCGDPEDIKLEEGSVTIYDWVRPPDFAKTDKLYDNMVQKLEKTKSVMICFVQLKKDNKWFAENMITQYPSLACKYLYEDESDGTHTKFEITEVRDAKQRGKSFVIPCEYKWETKEVIRRDVGSGEE